jgi:hypothetical protein
MNYHNLTQWDEVERKHQKVAVRYAPFWHDEIQGAWVAYPLPWYRPFNILLHHWQTHDDSVFMHDHPRWSLTICLRGQITEKTPWREKVLRPGSIVFRSHKYIHGFRVDKKHSCKTWTLFIVGRRRYCQNTYKVTRRTEASVAE